MKHRILVPLLLAGMSLPLTAPAAEEAHHDHGNMHHADMASTHHGEGVIRKINEKTGMKVQIAHDPIPSLEWPSMTMWFQLQSPLPKELKAGDRVRFEMIQGNDKKWEITRIGKP